MHDKKVLVTGGAGFIGSHLVEKLLEKGYKVIAFDNFSWGSMENLNSVESEHLQIIKGDVTDLKSLRTAARDVDLLFHLAVLNLRVGLEDPISAFQANVKGTLNICMIANENRNIKRTIFTSSGAVYGRPRYLPRDEKHPLDATNPYAADKVAGEMYLRAFYESWGIPYVILRLFNTFGPRSQQTAYAEVIPKFVERIARGLPPIIFGTGKQRMDFTHVKDIVDGIVGAAESDKALNDVMNLASGQDVSINELADLVLKLLGKTGEIQPVYDEPRPHEKPVLEEIPSPIVSIAKAGQLFGYKPMVPFEVGVKEYIEQYRLKQAA